MSKSVFWQVNSAMLILSTSGEKNWFVHWQTVFISVAIYKGLGLHDNNFVYLVL